MKSGNIDYSVLIHFLSADCTETEKRAVEEWIRRDPLNKQKLEEFKKIWKSSAANKVKQQQWATIDKDWQTLSKKIGAPSVSKPEKDIPVSPHTTSSQPAPVYQLVRVAAIFLVASLIGIFAYQKWAPVQTGKEEPVLQEITTAMGQRVNLTLSDGTYVVLNSGSKMELPKVFETDKREVSLEGEAYFKVAKNADKPFLIHSAGVTTRVLGTSFSISAYPEDEQIIVAVEEGRVSFETNSKAVAQKAVLNARELGRYNSETRQIMTTSIEDLDLYLGWTEGYLKFKEAAMHKVAKNLERHFGVDVTFEDAAIGQKILTAHLKSRSIRNVLDVISMSLDIEYRLQDNEVTFFKQ
jgi:ferric-dicitrate binding protein FerR (iron transport regulator)